MIVGGQVFNRTQASNSPFGHRRALLCPATPDTCGSPEDEPRPKSRFPLSRFEGLIPTQNLKRRCPAILNFDALMSASFKKQQNSFNKNCPDELEMRSELGLRPSHRRRADNAFNAALDKPRDFPGSFLPGVFAMPCFRKYIS